MFFAPQPPPHYHALSLLKYQSKLLCLVCFKDVLEYSAPLQYSSRQCKIIYLYWLCFLCFLLYSRVGICKQTSNNIFRIQHSLMHCLSEAPQNQSKVAWTVSRMPPCAQHNLNINWRGSIICRRFVAKICSCRSAIYLTRIKSSY